MVKKDSKGSFSNLKTLRFLVEIIETENGFTYTIRTENGTPVAIASSLEKFHEDIQALCSDFENFTPGAHGNEEN